MYKTHSKVVPCLFKKIISLEKWHLIRKPLCIRMKFEVHTVQISIIVLGSHADIKYLLD